MIRSMQKVLDDFAQSYLEARFPDEKDDLDVVYDISSGVFPEECEDGHTHGFSPGVMITVWCQYPEGPRQEHPPPVICSRVISAYLVNDGDTGPLEQVLDEVADKIAFSVSMAPLQGVFMDLITEDERSEEDEES